MQATREQLAEEDDHHHHASNVEVVEQNLQHAVRSSHGLGTQEANSEFQESYDDARQKFEHAVRLKEDSGAQEKHSEEQESYKDAEEEEEFSFSFDGGAVSSPIAAEDAFHNGQIKPMFPLFNQDLLLQERYFEEHLTLSPNVKKVLVEMNKRSLGDDAISGPFCEWEPEQLERDRCKKSSSTGFSKLWRLKDFVIRSNSNGRDAFVFLNNRSTSTLSSDQNSSSFRRKEDKKAATSGGGGGGGGGEEEEVKKGGKKKTPSLSSHEVYLKNKAKDYDGRKKSYMPYRPEVVGFFTNVNGGSISKNVHPY